MATPYAKHKGGASAERNKSSLIWRMAICNSNFQRASRCLGNLIGCKAAGAEMLGKRRDSTNWQGTGL